MASPLFFFPPKQPAQSNPSQARQTGRFGRKLVAKAHSPRAGGLKKSNARDTLAAFPPSRFPQTLPDGAAAPLFQFFGAVSSTETRKKGTSNRAEQAGGSPSA